MKNTTIDILGTPYNLIIKNKDNDDPILEDNNGYCDWTVKELVVEDPEKSIMSYKNLEVFKRKVARHEIVHAFLIESGLDSQCDWARNEEVVDYFARQIEKIYKACKEADALEEGR